MTSSRPRAKGRERGGSAAAFAICAIVAAAFCRESLLPGYALLPASPATVEPWRGAEARDASTATPSNPLMMDALIITLPSRVYNHDRLRTGEIPFWNPDIYCGYPHFALIQNNALYPLSAPLDVLDPVASLAWSIFLHLLLAGGLMWVYLRRSGLGFGAALVGAVAFELNGMFLVRASAPSYVFSGTWLPLLLLGGDALARSGRVRDGFPLIAGTALAILGGHPQIAALAFVLALAHALWLQRRGVFGAARTAAGIALLAALGVGIAGFQVVPFLELVRNSARGEVTLAVERGAALPFAGLLQALVPDVFGSPVGGSYWFPEIAHLIDGVPLKDRFWALNYAGENVFTGVAPLVLAAIAVARARRRSEVAFFAVAALASLGVLIGTPLLDAAYALVPGFRHSRPDRIVFVYMGAVAILCAHGCEAVLTRSASRTAAPRLRFDATATVVTTLAVALLAWVALPRLANPAARADLARWTELAAARWREQGEPLALQVAGCGAVLVASLALAWPGLAARLPRAAGIAVWLALVSLPSLSFGWRFNPVQRAPVLGGPAVEPIVQAAAAEAARLGAVRVARLVDSGGPLLPANMAQLLGLADANGASAAGVDSYLGLVDVADPEAVSKEKYFRAFRDPAVASGGLLDLLNVGVVLSDRDLSARYPRVAGGQAWGVYRNPRALPRYFIVERVESLAGEAEVWRRVAAPDFDPRRTALAVGPVAGWPPAGAPSEPAGEASVTVESTAPLALRLRADAPRGGLLVSSEVDYPGWTARVDGAPAPIARVDGAFRGVALAPGRHVVELAFVARSFYLGLALSALSLAAVFALARASARRAGATP